MANDGQVVSLGPGPVPMLIRDVARFWLTMGCRGEFVVKVESPSGTCMAFRGKSDAAPRAEPERVPASRPLPGGQEHWQFFSDESGKLVDAATEDWLTAEVLCQRAKLPNSGDNRAILRELAGRGILEAAQGKGYRLSVKPPPKRAEDD